MRIAIVHLRKNGMTIMLLKDKFEVHDVPLSWDLNQIKSLLGEKVDDSGS